MVVGTQGQNDALSSLNMTINALDLAKESTGVAPARTAFTSASALLTLIQVRLLPIYAIRPSANAHKTR